MPTHFAADELAARRKAAAEGLADSGLDGLLMFRQESMYYLTGYDTFGYVFFQCLYMGADGETLTLLTRTPDVRQAEHTSMIPDVRVWYDAEGVNPAEDLKGILEEPRVWGRTLGDRDRRLRPHRLQPQARGGRSERLLRAGGGLGSRDPPADGQVSG